MQGMEVRDRSPLEEAFSFGPELERWRQLSTYCSRSTGEAESRRGSAAYPVVVMCGIAGLVDNCHSDVMRAVLRMMAASMAHRGPDDEGIEVVPAGDRLVGLCSRRLAIQDCSPHGHQPMRSSTTGNVLAFNGELYNVKSLRAELAARGHFFQGSSDTEVVLRGFDEWGMGCLYRFRGMFALALWDAPKRRLLL